ncbi:hypothetical protein HY374_03370 [Candidatus Berkelbacteria bacterium]|nr:hypothetical protein [Candidatus Berkelbacteria bacterium]
MYLSYLMGAEQIEDQELEALGVTIVGHAGHGNRKLKIPSQRVDDYRILIKEKMTPGFWNEFLDERAIHFIFKLKDHTVKEFTLSPDNEREIDTLCAQLNNEPPDKTANVYRYIADNDFYHDFMTKHYQALVER